MLDDQDRRTLESLERHLAATDPGFAARMRGTAPRPRFPLLPVLLLVLFALVPIVSLLFGPAAALTTILAGLAGIGIVGLVRRRRLGSPGD